MEDNIKKELLKYYLKRNTLINKEDKKSLYQLSIVNMMIKRIKLLLELSKYEELKYIVEFEKNLLHKNLVKNLDDVDSDYFYRMIEYSKFLDRLSIKNINRHKQ